MALLSTDRQRLNQRLFEKILFVFMLNFCVESSTTIPSFSCFSTANSLDFRSRKGRITSGLWHGRNPVLAPKTRHFGIDDYRQYHSHVEKVKRYSSTRIISLSSQFDDIQSDDDISRHRQDTPLAQTFSKAVVLQRSGDRKGALAEYQHFLQVAQSYDVDPSLYAEVYANMGAIYAMGEKAGFNNHMSETNLSSSSKSRAILEFKTKAKESFKKAVNYRPNLGSAWVNLALLALAEGKELGNNGKRSLVESALREARSCCVRALGLDNDDEQSRALAHKLVYDIDNMLRKMN